MVVTAPLHALPVSFIATLMSYITTLMSYVATLMSYVAVIVTVLMFVSPWKLEYFIWYQVSCVGKNGHYLLHFGVWACSATLWRKKIKNCLHLFNHDCLLCFKKQVILVAQRRAFLQFLQFSSVLLCCFIDCLVVWYGLECSNIILGREIWKSTLFGKVGIVVPPIDQPSSSL